jgi:hypothetical protein
MQFRFFLLLFIFCIGQAAYGQKVYVSISFFTNQDSLQIPLGDKLVYFVGTSESAFTNYKGLLVCYLSKRDTAKLFIQGFQVSTICLKDSTLKKDYAIKINMQTPLSYLNPVLVRPVKSFDQLAKDLEKYRTIPKELQKPEISPTSPITALYELFSKHAQNRDKLREQVGENNKRVYLNKLYRFYNYHGITMLDESNFDAFTDFHKLPLSFFAQNDFYDITQTLSSFYKAYKSSSNGY